jgi:hypothetical protein
MVGSSAVVMAMNNRREGEGGVAARSLVRHRFLMGLGMAGCGRGLALFLLEKSNYVCRRATNAGNNYIVNL